MNNRVEGSRQQVARSDEWADTKRGSIGLIQLLGQMMMLPLSVFVYSMDLFVRSMQGVQRVADEGMDVMLGSTNQTSGEVGILGQASAEGPGDRVVGNTTEISGEAPGNQSGLESSLANSSTDNGVKHDAERNLKETINMNDTDLSDDMLKLVRYKILFVKRDYETAFPEAEELVHDNITGDAFAAWKVAEFIQKLSDRKTEIPGPWKEYPVNPDPPKPPYRHNQILLGFPEKDKKYLRVYYQVLARYEREEARHEEDQIAVLKEIRNRL
ncbi:MAG TPA: hypothetical protein VKA78_15595 [Pyrinomonadaceae bacterium]|nr:hypothetical protein [Pyrinomonadaceae bacterium]